MKTARIVLILTIAGTLLSSAAPASAAGELKGLLQITSGSCSPGISGSWFRMILPTGTLKGPFTANGDSGCAGDNTYTLLSPGTDQGMLTGTFQPTAGFDDGGNSIDSRIVSPVTFYGIRFSVSTNLADIQTGGTNTPPRLTFDDAGNLAGDLSAFGASWNRQSFNQGAPKPGGARPAQTSGPSGTYNPSTGAFTLTWSSSIVGGPFANFTGQWHLEGTFLPAGSPGVAVQPAVAAPVAAAPVAAAAPDAAAAASPAPATAAGATANAAPAPEATAAAEDTESSADKDQPKLAASRQERSGFRTPLWAVILTAAAGLIAALVLVWLELPSTKAKRVNG